MTKKNFAFISYNHRDVKWAKWLRRKLEWYRLPAEIHNEYEDSRYIRPVFRDRDSLTSGVLNDELRKQLEASQYLIVICSPHSAHSQWVSDEVSAFIQMGRLEYIIPFIVDGTPDEAFPQALVDWNKQHQDQSLLGIAINDDGEKDKQKAFIRVVSRMLGIEFDTLWGRNRRLVMRRRIAAVAVAVIAVATLFGVWRMNQPFDTQIALEEASVHNPNLPGLKDAEITIRLENEEKKDTIADISTLATFTNIPHGMQGKEVELSFRCEDFLPVDTTVVLDKSITLPIRRDPSKYGTLMFYLIKESSSKFLPNVSLSIKGLEFATDANGFLTADIPLELQDTTYILESTLPLVTDTLYYGCTESSVVFVK